MIRLAAVVAAGALLAAPAASAGVRPGDVFAASWKAHYNRVADVLGSRLRVAWIGCNAPRDNLYLCAVTFRVVEGSQRGSYVCAAAYINWDGTLTRATAVSCGPPPR